MSEAKACPGCHALTAFHPCNCGYVEVPQIITLEAYFRNNIDAEHQANAEGLLLRVNSLLSALNITKATMTSGFRSTAYNEALGGAKNSKHCQGLAIDLAVDNLSNLLLTNKQLLVQRDMAMEDPNYCIMASGNTWTHIQWGLPPSGHTVFIPYMGPIKYR